MPFLFVLREKANPPTAIIIAGSNYKGISSFVHALIINLNEQVLAVLKKALQVKEGKEDYNVVKELIDVFCKEKSINTDN